MFFAPHKITCLTVKGNYIVSGTSEGSIILWDMRDTPRRCKYIKKIQELVGDSRFIIINN